MHLSAYSLVLLGHTQVFVVASGTSMFLGAVFKHSSGVIAARKSKLLILELFYMRSTSATFHYVE